MTVAELIVMLQACPEQTADIEITAGGTRSIPLTEIRLTEIRLYRQQSHDYAGPSFWFLELS